MINEQSPHQSQTHSFLFGLLLVGLVSGLISLSSFLHARVVVSEPSVTLLLFATSSTGTVKLLEEDHRHAAWLTRLGFVTLFGKDDELVGTVLVGEACTVAHFAEEEEARIRRGETRGLGDGWLPCLLRGGIEVR